MAFMSARHSRKIFVRAFTASGGMGIEASPLEAGKAQLREKKRWRPPSAPNCGPASFGHSEKYNLTGLGRPAHAWVSAIQDLKASTLNADSAGRCSSANRKVWDRRLKLGSIRILEGGPRAPRPGPGAGQATAEHRYLEIDSCDLFSRAIFKFVLQAQIALKIEAPGHEDGLAFEVIDA